MIIRDTVKVYYHPNKDKPLKYINIKNITIRDTVRLKHRPKKQ